MTADYAFLAGLCDTVSIYDRTTAESGYGSVAITETLVVSNYKCRKTRSKTLIDRLLEVLDASGRRQLDRTWNWVGEYNVLIKDGQILKTSDSEYHSIGNVIPKRDSSGHIHHLKLQYCNL